MANAQPDRCAQRSSNRPALTPRSAGSGDTLRKETGTGEQRDPQNRMIEALDTELGRRFWVETSLARRGASNSWLTPGGQQHHDRDVGDNGTLGNMVKTAVQPSAPSGHRPPDGVWVPLIVSGAGQPARPATFGTWSTWSTYQLFGEIAGLDVHANVPAYWIRHRCSPTSTSRPAQRSVNFSQGGANIQRSNGGRNGHT